MNESDEKLRQLIAENIAYYRKLNGDTQAGLAEKLNVFCRRHCYQHGRRSAA